jgi:Cu-Zn family superoxide dismutase
MRFIVVSLGALAAALIVSSQADCETLKARAVADVIGLTGVKLGSAEFGQTSRGVLIELDLHGLTPGAHAVHIHGAGVCEPSRQFYSAGPHLSFEPRAHGYFAKGGPHEGDLPNQFAASDGTLHASMITNAFTLGNGERSIFGRTGASIILGARSDDYLSQPSGNSGGRIACGVIMRTVAPGTRKGAAHPAHK